MDEGGGGWKDEADGKGARSKIGTSLGTLRDLVAEAFKSAMQGALVWERWNQNDLSGRGKRG